ncbi:recombinase family protein [Sphingomonas colocasiae]|uniref:Recombinase family protein n=1 Tax=Sphingomonas colocasiae TaxID=1848973 RepID=A0ABS7PSH4_9SPHN|nr:recombinase family protein [Sphingomonas colocasiae]MBY8824292.1 recombinase family protein [Sphingomonas colocasiae]
MLKVALYARFSSDAQKESSIDQQLRLLRERAANEGWQIVAEYSDKALSGSNMLRPGLKNLVEAARARQFDIVLSESIDRLSRDQGDIANMHKRFRHWRISIVTLIEGEVNELHIGLKGTMSALYIRDLARRTHRGLQDRILNGESAGGHAYGYDIEPQLDSKGKRIGGKHTVNISQGAIVVRILEEFASGKSAPNICIDLNAEGIPGPRGRPWSPSTITGNRQRGTGILNNERYIGKLVWNRQQFSTDPDTGRGNGRLRDESEWIRADAPHLRIVSDELWSRVKERQFVLERLHPLRSNGRPKYLLSFLLKCGECGGGMNKMSTTHIGCGASRKKGTCQNRLTVSQKRLEEAVLDALSERLVDPRLCDVFCKEYIAHINRIRAQVGDRQAERRTELDRIERDLQKMIEAIKRGVDADLLKVEMNGLHARKHVLLAEMDTKMNAPVFIHPNMAKRYHEAINQLFETLNDPEYRTMSIEVVRSLIEKIVMTPNADRSALVIDLHGDLAGILQIAAGRPPQTEEGATSLTLEERSEIREIQHLAKTLMNHGNLALAGLDGFMPPQPTESSRFGSSAMSCGKIRQIFR